MTDTAKYSAWFEKVKGLNVGVKEDELVAVDATEVFSFSVQ